MYHPTKRNDKKHASKHETNMIQALAAQAFELGRVPHDEVDRPLSKEELMQPVVCYLGNDNNTMIHGI